MEDLHDDNDDHLSTHSIWIKFIYTHTVNVWIIVIIIIIYNVRQCCIYFPFFVISFFFLNWKFRWSHFIQGSFICYSSPPSFITLNTLFDLQLSIHQYHYYYHELNTRWWPIHRIKLVPSGSIITGSNGYRLMVVFDYNVCLFSFKYNYHIGIDEILNE